MKRLLLTAFAGLLFSCSAFGQGPYSYNFINTGTNGPGVSFANTGITSFSLAWSPQTTVATCSVQVDSSSDGVSWGNGDLIASQSCTTVGSAAAATFATGKSWVRVHVTALTGNGGLNVTLTGSVGGSSSGGGSSSAGQLDPTQAPYNVKTDAKLGNDGGTTNTQPTFTSTNQSCVSTDVGKLAIVVNTATGVYPFGTGLVTVLSCNGAAWTLSGNANATLSSGVNWAIGSDNGAGFAAANLAAFAANKILAIPCGPMVVATPPFNNLPTTAAVLTQHPDIQGCNSTGGSVFIMHPNISGGASSTDGLFALWLPPNPGTGAINYAGLSVDAKIENLTLTSLGGNIPGGSNSFIYWGNGYVRGIQMQGISCASAGCIGIKHVTEVHLENLSLQNFAKGNAGSAPFIAMQASGAGIAWVNHVICAFTGISTCWDTSLSTNAEMLVFENSYCVQTVGCLKGASGSTYKIVGNDLNANGINVNDNNQPGTYYLFANNAHNVTASTAVFNFQNAGTVADISGTICTPATAGFCATGAGTINDRVGNTFSSPLTQFTGKYVPIGGGSSSNNGASAATNFGANLGATNVLVAVSPAVATYDVKIGFRQVTAGVGCGAGSNTVTGVLSWTSGGTTFSTGSNGVPALGTLTISANGSVGATGSTNAYVSQPVHVDGNTQITFTTTSTLASAGCTIVPQYVVDFSTI